MCHSGHRLALALRLTLPLLWGAFFIGSPLPAAQGSEFDLSAELVGFGDFPVSADSDRDSLFAGRIDTYLTGTDIWEGGSFSAQLEYVDGDDFLGADDAVNPMRSHNRKDN